MSEENTPQEQSSEEKQGFWAKNILSIFLILFLIISGIYAFNRNPAQNNDTEVEEKVEEIKQSEEQSSEESSQEADTENEFGTENTSDESKNEEIMSETTASSSIIKTDSGIQVTAQSGDGVTHLARKAVAEYIASNNISLSKEQKLYAETVLKNQYYQHHLNIGDTIDFSNNSLEDTVNNAQNLTQAQISAWGHYVQYVPSL